MQVPTHPFCFGFSELDTDVLLDLGCHVFSIGLWPGVAQINITFLGLAFSLLLNGLIKFGSWYFIGMEGGSSLSSSVTSWKRVTHLSILWV
jgi:hypothetical protein